MLPSPTVVGLFFDPKTEAIIRRAWADVARQSGLPDKLGDMLHGRPHLSIGIYEDGQDDKIEAELAKLARNQKPFAIRFESYGYFDGTRGILFFGPAANAALLSLHRDFQVRAGGLAAQWEDYYLPEKLAFHCSINIGLDKAQLLRAMEAILDFQLPLLAQVESIGLLRSTPGDADDSFTFSA